MIKSGNHIKNGLWLLLACFALQACEKEFKIPKQAFDQAFVVNGEFTPFDPFKISITSIQSNTDNSTAKALTGVDVRIYDNGNFKEQLQYQQVDSNGVLGYYVSTFNPEPGHVYRLEARKEGMKMAWAEDTMTYPMLVNNYRITSQPDSSRDTTPYRIDFTIQDNAAEKNNYYMQTWVDAKIPVYDSLSRDTVLKDFSFFISSYSRKSSNLFFLNNGFLYLYDDNFNGSSKDIHLIFKSLGIPANATDVYVNTLFRNARPAYHLYWRSLANYFNGNNNIFSQPRLVYTNMHDGYGYFAATNPNFQRIRIR